MTLFRVNVEHLLFVHAEDEKQAETIALSAYRDEEPTFDVRPVGHPSLVEPEFRDTHPHTEKGYHEDEDPTCAQIMAKETGGAQAP